MLATVCTAAVVGGTAVAVGSAAVEGVVESRVPISHTSAAAPNSSDSDPVRHIRENTATTTCARSRDWARDKPAPRLEAQRGCAALQPGSPTSS